MFFAILDSHINYVNLIWGQNLNAVSRIVTLQKNYELCLKNNEF